MMGVTRDNLFQDSLAPFIREYEERGRGGMILRGESRRVPDRRRPLTSVRSLCHCEYDLCVVLSAFPA